MAKVFIGMPAYNGERFIERAIRSLMAQSFKDWKLVISDDGSGDKTPVICRALAAQDPRIEYVGRLENLGMNGNFEYLVERADAPYFMWAAQDDMWEKDFLQACVALLDANPSSVVAHTGMANIDSYDRVVRDYPHYPDFAGPNGAQTIIRHLRSPEIMGRCNLMYALIRTDIAREVNRLYGNKIAINADHAYALGLVARGGVSIDPRVMFKKRQGGYSDPNGFDKESPDNVLPIDIGNPKNGIFPIARLGRILKAYIKACRGTGYAPLAVAVTLARAPRALWIYIRSRNYKKFFAPRPPMVIVQLKGRLGNQMFAYAMGRRLALKHGVPLKVDPYFLYIDNTPWAFCDYQLGPLNVACEIATKEEASRYYRYKRTYSKIHNLLVADSQSYASERQFEFDEEMLELGPDVYLDGFWQAERYFKPIESTIRKDFELKIPLEKQGDHMKKLVEEIASCESVCVNVRRGEYLHRPETNQWFGVLGMEYFEKAINLMKEKVPHARFYVFSDDIEWCEESFAKKPGFKVVDHSYSGEKFTSYQRLMSLCKHQIIPNSTFAWWAAWLNQNPNKIVIAPQKWFGKTKKPQSTRDLLPDSWIKI